LSRQATNPFGTHGEVSVDKRGGTALSTAPQKFQTMAQRLRARLFVARSSQISSG